MTNIPETPGPREILPEIADRTGRALDTIRTSWTRHPGWPAPTGKRGRWKEYDRAAVDAWLAAHITRPVPELEANRLYTVRQLEEAGVGLKAKSIRSDVSRGRWPAPDDTAHSTSRWLGRTVTGHLATRRRGTRG